ncbi:hypothetical protein J7L48_02680 [bacterium]|nr:hypothetical protein [bacterium]
MKKMIVIIFMMLLGNLFIFGEDTRPGIKPLNLSTKSDSIAKTTKANTTPNINQSAKQEKKKDEIKSDLPKIPQEWGPLVKGEFIMDGAYLAMYFEDSKGNIRVAIYSMDKKVKLYKLMIFPREIK